MTHKTRAIVLKTIRYGETSLVATIFTALYGIQTYLINGVRTSKKSGSKAMMFQPVSLLEMEVYHNDLKSMQRIKECNRSYLFKTLFTDVLRHSIALFMVELIYKTLKQPENNPDLFHFCEEALIKLDESDNQVAANMPLYFTLHLCYFFGFRIHPQHAEAESYVDLKEGTFTDGQPDHPYFLSGEDAQTTAELLRVMQVEELATIRLNGSRRRILLHAYLDFYALHIHDFGPMKTLPVLEEILA